MAGYEYRPEPFSRPPELDGVKSDVPVAIVGAGPIGLSMAIDLALHGIKSVVLDDNNVVSVGSRAICWSKRTLEIFDRLGVAKPMMEKGVTWKVGRLFHGDKQVYEFDLLPEEGHKFPAFINLQQYYVEEFLIARARQFPDLIDLRFLNKLVSHKDSGECVELSIDTPEGNYQLEAQYLLACDGASSPTRERMKLPFEGESFVEQFLIIDIELEENPFANQTTPERWFWFDPPFHQGKSALLHQQPDNIYRIDLQLAADVNAEEELREEKLLPRIKAIIGERPFRIDWKSLYRFRCMRLKKFVHNNVIFVGDSAHIVSPFGARGGNGGIQDVDNLAWKLAAILSNDADRSLLDSYDEERGHGANENLLNSSRATNFMTPKSEVEALFRAQTLEMAAQNPIARRMINSGRLSVPCAQTSSSLVVAGSGKLPSGTIMLDAPLGEAGWLSELMKGEFVLLGFGEIELPDCGVQRVGIGEGQVNSGKPYPCFEDSEGFALERYGQNCAYLMRPDGVIATSFLQHVDRKQLQAAHLQSLGYQQTKEVA